MTLNYIGSKKTLIPFIEQIILDIVEKPDKLIFADLFAGTGIVGQHFEQFFKGVYANDIEGYSTTVLRAILCVSYTRKLADLIQELNTLDGQKGLVYKYYSENSERLFFTNENAKKTDASRIKIDKWFKKGSITRNEKVFLIASLIQSIDKVANTTSVYGAFLKKFKSSALRELIIKPIHTNTIKKRNKVTQKNISDVLNIDFDVVYLDPPYVARQYGAYYAPLNFIVNYDDSVVPRGKTGLIDYFKSDFASKSNVIKAFEYLFENLSAKYIFLSYNNNGLLSSDKLKEILLKRGSVTLYTRQYKAYSAKANSNKIDNYEYLYCVIPSEKSKYTEINL